jgi:hypothetical protein
VRHAPGYLRRWVEDGDFFGSTTTLNMF